MLYRYRDIHLHNREREKEKMVLKKFIKNTKTFLHKTNYKLKSFVIIGYKKLPKCHSVNTVSSNNVYPNVPQMDQCSKQLDVHSETDKKSTPTKEANINNSTSTSQIEEFQKYREERKELGKAYEQEKRETLKLIMRKLEMMDLNDVNQTRDIEEAMHYYSCLKSPVYIEIVDKFFMDMYTEFLVQKPSVSASSSSRRLGPVKL